MVSLCLLSDRHWLWEDTKLLQQPQLIHPRPALHRLATHDPVDISARQHARSPCRRDTLELTGMRASCHPASNDPVSLSHLILDDEMQIGERRAQSAKELADGLRPLQVAPLGRGVDDEIT